MIVSTDHKCTGGPRKLLTVKQIDWVYGNEGCVVALESSVHRLPAVPEGRFLTDLKGSGMSDRRPDS